MSLFDLSLTLSISDSTWVSFLVLITIPLAPMILGRLHIPHTIGMILAGALISEYGFHVFGRDSSFELLGKIGLHYIMLPVDLKMDMGDFGKNRTKNFVSGWLTFLIPMVLGIWSSMSVLGCGFLTAVSLASMYASRTLIAYPIISRYGLPHLHGVDIITGGTAVTVTLVLIILAVIGGIFKGTADGWFWVFLTAKVALLGFLIVFFFPRIGHQFFRKHDDSVMRFVFVLAMVFLGGGLMEFAGMEGTLGAFLAGLVLNRLIPHVSPLMSRLEFVRNALFIPYLLIGVGMIIDVRSLFTGGEALKVAIMMTVVATFNKWLAAQITQKIYRTQSSERNMIFGLSNAQAVTTLATVLIGHEIIMENGERLLNDDVLNGTVVMILFTCVISSLATERSARRFALDENVQAEEEAKKVNTEQTLILVANSETIEDLTNLALVIKDTKQKNALVALNVINDNNSPEKKEQQGRRSLEKAAMIVAVADVPITMVSHYDLNIASGIIHIIEEYEATGIVIGLHREANIVDSFFKHLVESLSKDTHREVMIAKFLMPVNTLRRINIVVPPKVEYESGFSKWVEHFCRMGSTLGCRVHFFVSERTLMCVQQFVKKRHADTPTEFFILEEWEGFLLLTAQVNYDHLLVVIPARRGSASYDPSFEYSLARLRKYFSNNSLITLYPGQLGEPQEAASLSNPRGYNESQHYEKIGKWFYKWLKKN